MSGKVDPRFAFWSLMGKPEVDPNVDLVLEDVGKAQKKDSRIHVPLKFDDGVCREPRAGGLADVAQDHVDKADGHGRDDYPRSELAGELGESVGPALVGKKESEEQSCFPACALRRRDLPPRVSGTLTTATSAILVFHP